MGELIPFDERMARWETGIRTYLVTGSSKQAALAAGVNQKTWQRWQKEEEFQRLLQRRRDQVAKVGTDAMGELFLSAIEALHEALGPTQELEVRLKAAQTVLRMLGPSKLQLAGQVEAEPAPEVDPQAAAEELRRRRAEEAAAEDDQELDGLPD